MSRTKTKNENEKSKTKNVYFQFHGVVVSRRIKRVSNGGRFWRHFCVSQSADLLFGRDRPLSPANRTHSDNQNRRGERERERELKIESVRERKMSSG